MLIPVRIIGQIYPAWYAGSLGFAIFDDSMDTAHSVIPANDWYSTIANK